MNQSEGAKITSQTSYSDSRESFKSMRITYRITDENPAHIRFSLWVNGGLICEPGGLCLRVSEVGEFFERLKAKTDDQAYKDGDI